MYIVVGANPIVVYTGTTTFTELRKIGIYKTEKEAAQAINENYHQCAGLIKMFEVSKEEGEE